MYYSFFGLKEKPFNVTPDPRFLFLSKYHQEALGHLLYGIQERKGFIEITGEVGTGKTILCRTLLNQVGKDVHTALIFNSYLSEIELLQSINTDFGLSGSGNTRKELIDELNRFLIEQFSKGKNAVLVIDEAQNLDPPVLEQIRMLSNLETDSGKLLQIVLVGQPELRELLSRPDLRQLEQRITVQYHIRPLDRSDTEKYIYHRLLVAGSRGELEFTKKALDEIYRYSRGVPRRINILCDHALLHAYASDRKRVDIDIVKRAVEEIERQKRGGVSSGRKFSRHSWWHPFWRGAVAGVSFLVLTAIAIYMWVTISPFPWINPLPQTELVAEQEIDSQIQPPPSPSASIPVSQPPAPETETIPPEKPEEVSVVSAPEVPQTASDTAVEVVSPVSPVEQQYREQLQQILKQYGVLTPQTISAGFNVDLSPTWLHFDRLRAFKVPFLAEIFPEDPARAEILFILETNADQIIGFGSRGEKRVFDRRAFSAIWYGKTYLLHPRGVNHLRILREGATGPDVRKIQENLSLLGYYKAQPTGQFDAETRNAVRYFQRDYNLQVDGYVGPETRLMLYYVTGETL